MDYEHDNPAVMTARRSGVAGAETVPAFGASGGRELAGRLLPPLLAMTSVIAIWWGIYLLYPRLLPSPWSTGSVTKPTMWKALSPISPAS